MKEGKFRKNFELFDLKESIKEILQILKYKSD
jgi:hypothetical protein